MLMMNEEIVNKVQELIWRDNADLVNTATSLRSYTTNITNALQQVQNALQEFQVALFQMENVTVTDVYDTVMFTLQRQQRQLYYNTRLSLQ